MLNLAPVAAADPADPDKADPDKTVPRHDPVALADAIGVVLAELDDNGSGMPASGSVGADTRRSNPWR